MRITKRLFLEAVQCLTQAWLSLRAAPRTPSPAEQFLTEEGLRVGRAAQALYADGYLIESRNLYEAVAETKVALDHGREVIFEGAFFYGSYVTRADILVRDKADPKLFHLIEVKSGRHYSQPKAQYVDDIAYTALILTKAGVHIGSATLLSLNAAWRQGMPARELFLPLDCTDHVLDRMRVFEPLLGAVAEHVLGETMPESQHKHCCGKCPHFDSQCLGVGVEDPIHQLPRLSRKLFEQCYAVGVVSIHNLTEEVKLSPIQSRVVAAVKGRTPHVDKALLRARLNTIRWPALFLDFESVSFAIPPWPDIGPHEAIVTQYSIHMCERFGEVAAHREFLSEHKCAGERELAERLIRDLEGRGSVIVYSAYEKTMLNAMARRYPELAEALGECVHRIFDLEKVFSESYYHPGFRGRTSIKVTLPVLVPELSYDGLYIGDGGAASALFARMVMGELPEAEVEKVRAGLLEYCGLDTLGMVKVGEVLWRTAEGPLATELSRV